MQAGRHGTGAVIESLHLIVKMEGERNFKAHASDTPPKTSTNWEPNIHTYEPIEAILIQTTRPSFQVLGIQACATALGFIFTLYFNTCIYTNACIIKKFCNTKTENTSHNNCLIKSHQSKKYNIANCSLYAKIFTNDKNYAKQLGMDIPPTIL